MSKTESDHIKNLDLSDRIWIQILKTPHSTSFQKTGSTTPLVRTGLAGPGNGNQVGGFPWLWLEDPGPAGPRDTYIWYLVSYISSAGVDCRSISGITEI